MNDFKPVNMDKAIKDMELSLKAAKEQQKLLIETPLSVNKDYQQLILYIIIFLQGIIIGYIITTFWVVK